MQSTPFNNLNSKPTKGFTIVELLIVIVVIGILAAITIVAFNGIQNRGHDTSVQTDLSNFGKKILTETITNNDVIPLPAASMGIKLSKSSYMTTQNNVYFCKNDATGQFVISARSKTGKQYKYLSAGGISEHPSTIYGEQTCNLVGQPVWGGGYASMGYDNPSSTWAAWLN